jgi:outer membrane protein OmpA-like peptidoglycan-associated protein
MGFREWRAGYGSGVHLAPALGVMAAVALGSIVIASMQADAPQRLEPAPVTVGSTTIGAPDSSAPASTDVPATDAPDATDEPRTQARAPSTTVRRAPSTTSTTTTTTTIAATTTVAPTTTVPPFATLPDGSPEPVVAIFDVDEIELRGAVPTQADAERLTALALANSKTPATVVNNLTLNPAVPRNVGVRVIELTSVRFPEGSAEIGPEHAAELDRIASVMAALPHTNVIVVGHADQRGDEVGNYQLSDDRARAVVNHLVGRGIAASRLASRAVGENDLLTIANDPAGLALNRRTEFIFSGLLQG